MASTAASPSTDETGTLLRDETPVVIDRSTRRTWLIRLYETGGIAVTSTRLWRDRIGSEHEDTGHGVACLASQSTRSAHSRSIWR
jgi:hypothetical protein